MATSTHRQLTLLAGRYIPHSPSVSLDRPRTHNIAFPLPNLPGWTPPLASGHPISSTPPSPSKGTIHDHITTRLPKGLPAGPWTHAGESAGDTSQHDTLLAPGRSLPIHLAPRLAQEAQMSQQEPCLGATTLSMMLVLGRLHHPLAGPDQPARWAHRLHVKISKQALDHHWTCQTAQWLSQIGQKTLSLVVWAPA